MLYNIHNIQIYAASVVNSYRDYKNCMFVCFKITETKVLIYGDYKIYLQY